MGQGSYAARQPPLLVHLCIYYFVSLMVNPEWDFKPPHLVDIQNAQCGRGFSKCPRPKKKSQNIF